MGERDRLMWGVRGKPALRKKIKTTNLSVRVCRFPWCKYCHHWLVPSHPCEVRGRELGGDELSPAVGSPCWKRTLLHMAGWRGTRRRGIEESPMFGLGG